VDAAPSGPAIFFSSQHGHSQILVTSSSAVLNVAYSEDWQTRQDEGRQYLKARVPLLFDVLETLDSRNALFCGSQTRVQMPSTLEDEEIAAFVAERFTKGTESNRVHDVIVKVTSIVEDLFFNNLTVQNYRSFNLPLFQPSLIRLSRKNAAERGIEITNDFNNRYAFNEDKSFHMDRSLAIDIMERNLKALNDVTSTLRSERK
jgi:hypothetical protein